MLPIAGGPIGSTLATRPPCARSRLVPLSISAPSWLEAAPVGCSWARGASNLQRGPPPSPLARGVAVVVVPELLGTCLAPLAEGSVTAETVALFLGGVVLDNGCPFGTG